MSKNTKIIECDRYINRSDVNKMIDFIAAGQTSTDKTKKIMSLIKKYARCNPNINYSISTNLYDCDPGITNKVILNDEEANWDFSIIWYHINKKNQLKLFIMNNNRWESSNVVYDEKTDQRYCFMNFEDASDLKMLDKISDGKFIPIVIKEQ